MGICGSLCRLQATWAKNAHDMDESGLSPKWFLYAINPWRITSKADNRQSANIQSTENWLDCLFCRHL